jgi:hypothetical protein
MKMLLGVVWVDPLSEQDKPPLSLLTLDPWGRGGGDESGIQLDPLCGAPVISQYIVKGRSHAVINQICI